MNKCRKKYLFVVSEFWNLESGFRILQSQCEAIRAYTIHMFFSLDTSYIGACEQEGRLHLKGSLHHGA